MMDNRTIDLVREILVMVAGCVWTVTERPVGFLESHICISTAEPMHADIKDVIKRLFYERTPVGYKIHLTFARKKLS